MAVDLATFRIRFPEFNDDVEFPDPRIELFLEDAACIMGEDENRWLKFYNKAQAYLTAHKLILGGRTELGDSNSKLGAITSKSAGGVSVSRQASTQERTDSDDALASTSYGVEYLGYRNLCFVGAFVTSEQ